VRLYLDELLQIVRSLVADVGITILVGLVGNFELAIDLRLVEPDTCSELGQSLVCVVTGLIHDIGVEIVRLLVEQGFGKVLAGFSCCCNWQIYILTVNLSESVCKTATPASWTRVLLGCHG